MQADDVIRLVSSGAGRRRGGLMSSKFLRPMLTSMVPRFLGISPETTRNDEEPVAEEVREEADNESTAANEPSRCASIWSAKMHIIFFVFILAVTLNWSGAGYAVGRKTCLKYNTTAEYCKRWQNSSNQRRQIGDLFDFQRHHHHKNHGSEAEQAAQLYLFYQGLVAFVPSAILVLVLASCCDEFSSFRLPLTVSIVGTLGTTTANLVSSFHPGAPLFYDILTPLAEMLCGGLPLVLTCVYVHVAATVQRARRTTAFFLLQVCFMLAFAIGRLVSALVFDQWDTKPLFIGSLVMLSISALSVTCLEPVDLSADVDDEPRTRRKRQQHRQHGNTNQDPVLLSTRLFSHHHMFSSVRGLVQDQLRGSRYELLFLVVVIFFLVATTRSSISSFFLDADPENAVLDSSIIIVTLLLVMPVFALVVKSCPMDPNYTITMIGLLFLIVSQSLQFATNNPALNHIRQILHTISNIAPAGIRAHVATIVERKQFGKAFGIVAAAESVAPLIGSVVRKYIGHIGQLPFVVLGIGFVGFLAYGHIKGRSPSSSHQSTAEEA